MKDITSNPIQLFLIATTFISGIITILVRSVIKLMFDKNFEDYKNKIQIENSTNKMTLDKEVESFKTSMSILVARQSSLYQKRSEVIESLYKYLIKFYYAMDEMTIPIRQVTDENRDKEEQERISEASRLGNDFIQFYFENKIYFDKETCEIIDKIKKLLKQSHNDYTFNLVFGIPPSEITYEVINKARERVENEIPRLIENLEDSFRKSIGVVENNPRGLAAD